jgi:NADH dehydrogenase (ubiquinone) Fe-S protein 6
MLRHSVQRLSTSTLRKTPFKSVAAYTTTMQPSAKSIAPEISQAENRTTTWSKSQLPKAEAMVGPRFEQIDISTQVRLS